MSVHMPKRSVTRFFVPLIDVLLLLFCIFLLMPMAEEDKINQAAEENAELSAKVAFNESEVGRRNDDLLQREQVIRMFEDDQDAAKRVARMQSLEEQIRLLQAQIKKLDAQKTNVIALDIDAGDDANLFYYDRSKPKDSAGLLIKDKKIADKFIEERQKEADAAGRKVFFLFLYPRPAPIDFPDGAQIDRINQYRQWFSKVDNSLKEK